MPVNTTLERWLYALKPGSWAKLWVPALLGQALGVVAAGGFDVRGAVVGVLFTILDLIFIVLLNDWGDADVDAIKRRMFPDGCSPKTIPDGILPAPHLLIAGIGAGVASVLVAFLGGWWLGRPELGFWALLNLLVFWIYTFPPIKLNYRGGGELLEMIGVGAMLPWFNIYAQGGALWDPVLWVLPGFVLLSLSSALASGLSDEESDRAGGKRTMATTLGNATVRRLVEAAVVAGGVLWLVSPLIPGSPVKWWAAVSAVAVVAWYGAATWRSSAEAVTGAFAAQKRYKHHLHMAIWRGGMAMALLLVLGRFVPALSGT